MLKLSLTLAQVAAVRMDSSADAHCNLEGDLANDYPSNLIFISKGYEMPSNLRYIKEEMIESSLYPDYCLD